MDVRLVARYPGAGREVTRTSDTPTTGAKTPRARRPVLIDPKTGLRALKAAEHVLAEGPLRWGDDGCWWAYQDGLWFGDKPAERVVHGRIVAALGDHYRPAHGNAIRDVARALVPTIAADPVPEYINFTNGLLDWRHQDGPRLIPHDSAVPSTVQLSIPWAPDAQCPDWHRFLDQVIPADDIGRVWELVGYMLMSGNPLQRAFLFVGSGGNGKGVFMRTLRAILGKANISNVPLHDLSSNRFAVAQLYGRIANLCGDIDATYIEATGRFKEVSGEDEVQAEHKFGQPFRFTPWCKMLFSANAIPGSADSSAGWLRRWELVNFPTAIDRPDPGLEGRLRSPESLQGIAAGAVAALRVLMDRGAFRATESGDTAKHELARQSNPLYQWTEDRCSPGESVFEDRTALYRDYVFWAERQGLKRMSAPSFYTKLRQLQGWGLRETKVSGTYRFYGLALRSFRP